MTANDPVLRQLIDDGERILRHMETDPTYGSSGLYAHMFVGWVQDAQRCAHKHHVAVRQAPDLRQISTAADDSRHSYTSTLIEILKSITGESPSTITYSGQAFVSYVHEDTAKVRRLFEDLTSYGAELWLDRNDLAPGIRWKVAIREAVREGAFSLACFSRASVGKGRTYMNEELILAIEEIRQRPAHMSWFIPVRLDDCSVPDLGVGGGVTLRDFQVVDLASEWDRGVRQIIEVIAPLPRQLKTLIDHLESPVATERAAAEELYYHTDRRAFKSLVRALDDEVTAYWAARALGWIHDPRAIPALIRAAKREMVPIYKWLEIMGDFNEPEAWRAVQSYRAAEGDPAKKIEWFNEGDEMV